MSPSAWIGLSPSRAVFDNGLAVLAKRSPTTPAVTFSLGVRAGGALDPVGRAGLAHFLARTIDRGTTSRPADVIADQLDAAGVTLSAAATRHQLTLSCTCLADDFGRILDLVADIVRRPTLPEAEVETRRGEIITAIRQDEDYPAMAALEALFALLYPDPHPYGRRVKGTVESVARIGRADLVSFHQNYVRPEGASLVIVGDLDERQAIEAGEKVLGDWRGDGRRSAPAESTVADPPAGASRRRTDVVMPGKAQSDIAYGYVAAARNDPAYYDLLVMNNVFGQYALGGRLGDSIRERQGMAYYAFSAFEASLGRGPLVVRAGVNPANVERTLASIDEEVARLGAEGITAKELADSKRFLVGSLPRNLETNAAIAGFLQSAELFGLGLDHDRQLPALIDGVTLEGVNEAARRLLAPERAAVAVAGPGAGAEGV